MKRRAGWQGTRSQGQRGYAKYQRGGVRMVAGGRGRYAGYYRKAGFYGRYNKRDGGGELKFHDIAVDDATVSGTGDIQNAGSINLIGQGITESTRIGRKCTLRSMAWHIGLTIPEQDAQSTPVQGDTVRIILYLDKQANGATAAVTDILESADYDAFNNLANKSRFRTLCDKWITLNYAGMASDGAGVVSQARVVRQFNMFKKLNVPLEFLGVANPAAMTEVRSNNLGVLLISRFGLMTFDSKVRIRFSDG